MQNVPNRSTTRSIDAPRPEGHGRAPPSGGDDASSLALALASFAAATPTPTARSDAPLISVHPATHVAPKKRKRRASTSEV
jgi:hypothetical protein